jgi:pyruvate/2-oxoglutarate dehydrogenase complex dihydrolipoamide acyltransferase (E2) component
MRMRPERLLPLACIAAAVCLFASELMTTFEFTPPGGEPLADQGAGERHGNAMFLIAVFAIAATVAAVMLASRPAAIAVAATGTIALLIFLLNDLPDAGSIGTLDDPRQSFFDAEAVPQPGFWLEMVSAVGLALSGAALATLDEAQLAALRPARFGPPQATTDAKPQPFDAGMAPSTNASGPEPAASAAAARLAEQLGIDLAEVRGSGRDGRILKSDVEAARAGADPSRQRQREG